MAKLFTCKFDTKPLKPAINNYLRQAKKAVNTSLKDAAKDIANQAKGNCEIPSIRSTIKAIGTTVTVGQGLKDPEIAAYYEFGTGDFARSTVAGLPQDWSDYAYTFFVNGMGRLPAKPYLYRAYWSVTGHLVDEIQSKL